MTTETMMKRHEPTAQNAETGRTYTPPVDIVESKDGWLMLVDMPGAEPKEIDIQYENGLLTMRGKTQHGQRPGRFLLHEYEPADYERSFVLGEGINADKIQAEFKDGVMMLHLPKSEALKPRRIEVKGG